MNINGFEIDKYNQYDLPDKAKHSVCPLCSSDRKKSTEKCTSLDWNVGIGTCHHCGESFQLHTFKRKEHTVIYKKPQPIKLTDLSENAVNWFKSRGISEATLKAMKITEGIESMPLIKEGKQQKDWTKQNTVQFNYLLFGEIVNVKYRSGCKSFKMFADAERIFYNLDAIRLSTEAIIVEGEMDALAFIEAGLINVVSTPNGSTLKGVNLDYLDNYLEYFDNKEKIYLALDADEAGQNVQAEFIRRLGSEKCYTVDFNGCKDANEYLLKFGSDQLKQVIENAKQIPLAGVSSVYDFRTEYEKYVCEGMPKGVMTGIKSFDNIFSTYTKQFTVITGEPSSGKSEFVDSVVLGYLSQHGYKTAYASKENKPNAIHVGKLVSKLAGHWVNKPEYIKTDWFEKSLAYINDNIKFIDISDGYTLDSILELGDQMVRRFGIKVLVIDPFNKTPLRDRAGKNINEYTNEYLNKVDEWCVRNDAIVLLVAHPNKPTLEEKTNYRPTLYSVKGGGEFNDMTHHGLMVKRDFDNDLVEINVLKIKFSHLGVTGGKCFMRWNKRSGRYIEYDGGGKTVEECVIALENDMNFFTNTDTSGKDYSNPNKVDGYELQPIKPNEKFEEQFLIKEEIPF